VVLAHAKSRQNTSNLEPETVVAGDQATTGEYWGAVGRAGATGLDIACSAAANRVWKLAAISS